ncbi:MAG: cation:proton antiporter [Chloroflexi bacterium]|nr:cation:proton antiporter [Chloroflexota bacterium]
MGEDFTHSAVILAMQLGIILVVAKLAGDFTERILRQPAVIGELVAGIIIGTVAIHGFEPLGYEPIGLFEELFEPPEEGAVIPVPKTLFVFGQVAAIILLLETGLNTDLKAFLRFVPQASVVAIGGVVVPFALGAYATVLFGFADSFFSAPALFVGTIMTATSVGITARVLADLLRLDSPEGVTILGAAVVDDVLGILILTVVVGVTAGESVGAATEAASFEWTEVAIVGAKAIGFWLVLTVGGILGARYIVRAINSIRVEGAAIAIVFGIGLFAAALAEMFGLAMIIGAYSVGLALSQTELRNQLHQPLNGLYHAMVPVFFVVMGMMVNIEAMRDALGFGLIVVVLAIIGKVAGSGLPALAAGFSRIGAWRVGVGMAPRGEVGLIVAGIGVSQGLIGQDLFGVAILMTIATTLIAPAVLVSAFRNNAPGLRRDQATERQV